MNALISLWECLVRRRTPPISNGDRAWSRWRQQRRDVKARADLGSVSVALWDDEVETLRPRLREEAAAFLASFPWQQTDTATLSLEERVAASRSSSLVAHLPTGQSTGRSMDPPDLSGFACSLARSPTACSSISTAARGCRARPK